MRRGVGVGGSRARGSRQSNRGTACYRFGGRVWHMSTPNTRLHTHTHTPSNCLTFPRGVKYIPSRSFLSEVEDPKETCFVFAFHDTPRGGGGVTSAGLVEAGMFKYRPL